MIHELVEIIRRHSRSMEPIPSGAEPKLSPLTGIRAVMFDVYGTLVISGSGDVGTVAAAPGEAFSQACQAVGLHTQVTGDEGAGRLVATIKQVHEQARRGGTEYPEVDIIAVWRQTIEDLRKRGWLDAETEEVDFERLAIEYEVRANPVWKMPELESCLERLTRAELRLGIVSNAQFFTPLLFPALLQKPLPELGFCVNLCFYSYQHGHAKPDTFLYKKAKQSLERLGISTGEVLYVGNDMLNDVLPARTVGFKTALFAGDQRSLRLRTDDNRVAGVEPDIVITQLDQLFDALTVNR